MVLADARAALRPRVVTRPRVGGFLCDVLWGVVLYPQCYLMYNLVTENRDELLTMSGFAAQPRSTPEPVAGRTQNEGQG